MKFEDRTVGESCYPIGATQPERVDIDVTQFIDSSKLVLSPAGLHNICAEFERSVYQHGGSSVLIPVDMEGCFSGIQTLAVANGDGWTCMLVTRDGCKRIGVISPKEAPE